MPRGIPRICQNLALALCGVSAALLLSELAARLLPSPYEGSADAIEVCSSQMGWRGKPHFTTTVETDSVVHDLVLNSAGMHDTEHPLAKPPNTFRILMLGDSFVRAHQVRETETTHQVLENLLNSAGSASRYEVINGGVDGWGTGQELIYYRSEGRLYHPDLVLLMFYIGNDVKDNMPARGITSDVTNCYAPYFVLCGDRLDPTPWLYAPGLPPSIGQCGWPYKTLSAILGVLHRYVRLYTQLEPLLPAPDYQVSSLYFFIEGNPLFDYGLRLTVQLVRQLNEEVTQDGAQFAVVLISPEDLVGFSLMSSAERERIYQEIPALRRAEQIDMPDEQLSKVFAGQGIRVLDLLPAFSRYTAETGRSLHFEHDKHWNADGNRLAAETLSAWLASNPGLTDGSGCAIVADTKGRRQ
jgi:hypothetical protein